MTVAMRGGYEISHTLNMTINKKPPGGDLLFSWWGYLDLNQGPISYEPTALTS